MALAGQILERSVGTKLMSKVEHDKLVEQYSGIVMAALEGLRAAIYPHGRLENFYHSDHSSQHRTGWAIGVDQETGESSPTFHEYIYVTLEFDHQDQPVRFNCQDDAGHQSHTAKGDLSREGLVKAIEKLHQKKERQWWQIWRWL